MMLTCAFSDKASYTETITFQKGSNGSRYMTFSIERRITTHAFIDICHMGPKCARDEGEEGRKDTATGVSSLSTIQKVYDPFFQLLMSYLALKHMFCNSYWARGNRDSHAHLDIIF
jgi:hypothetical protein